MKLTATEELPHFEYDKMEVTIEPWTDETRIEIEIKDGYGDKKNSRVTMSLADFDMACQAVARYRRAITAIEGEAQ